MWADKPRYRRAQRLAVRSDRTVAGYFLMPLLARFNRVYPDISVVLEEGHRRGLEQSTANGPFDLSLIMMQESEHFQDLLTKTLHRSARRLSWPSWKKWPVAYPSGRIHVIWDNLNTHRAYGVWRDFNARHEGRFVFHFTPLHASWVNQIELLFGIYTRRVLRHACHRSVKHLRQRTEEFIEQRNISPKPFRWTFAGYELQTGESRHFNKHARHTAAKSCP